MKIIKIKTKIYKINNENVIHSSILLCSMYALAACSCAHLDNLCALPTK